MAQGLFDRIAMLLRADAHGVVGALEDRSLLLEQGLREAELDLLGKRARRETLEQEEARVRERAERARTAIAALDEDVELALAGEREELARFAIRRLLPLRAERAALEREAASLASARAALDERLAQQEAELEELRGRVRARLARGAETGPAEFAAPVVDEAEVELELLRRRGAGAQSAQAALPAAGAGEAER